MALQWQFDSLIGACKVNSYKLENPYWVTMYEGNAFLIMNYETEETYSLWNFFIDEQHLKNCIKNINDIWKCEFQEILIFTEKSRNWKKIIDLFLKTVPDCKITIQKSIPDRKQFFN